MSLHAHKDRRIHDVDDEEQYNRARANENIIHQMIDSMKKHTLALNAAKTGSKQLYQSMNTHVDEMANHVDNLDKIHQATNSITAQASQYTKQLGELAGVLGVVNSVTSANIRERESRETSSNYKKAIYHLQNGSKLEDVAPALGVGALKSLMNGAGTFAAGKWLHDIITTGAVSNATNTALGMSSPALMASTLFGGIGGLGSAMGSVGAKGLGAASWITGDGESGISGALAKGASSLGTLDPTIAATLGTLGMIGTGIGANHLMNNILKDSPLGKNNKKSRFSLSTSHIHASKDPVAMSNYIQSNNLLKTLQNQNMISPGETQIIGKLNEIAFYTSSLQPLLDLYANNGRLHKNSSSKALNAIDNEYEHDLSGKELKNLFNDGKINNTDRRFLKFMEGINYIGKSLSVSNIITSLKGGDTAPEQYALRDALNHGDPMRAQKNFAQRHGLTLTAVNLIHDNILTKIKGAGDTYEARMMAATTISAILQQQILTKLVSSSGGNGSIIGELAREINAMNAAYQSNQSLLIDGTIKPIMQSLSKIPVLSAMVPAMHAAHFISTGATKTISGLTDFLGNLTTTKGRNAIGKGFSGFFKDIKDKVIDGMLTEDSKSEANIRGSIGANALSLQDKAFYATLEIPKHLQRIEWLLGSTSKAKVMDPYTGEYVDEKTLRKNFANRLKGLRGFRGQENEYETVFDEASSWMKKKIFGIKSNDLRKATTNYSHYKNIEDELTSLPNASNQTQDDQFRIKPGNINFNTKQLVSVLTKLNSNISLSKKIDPRDDYYTMMALYIPMLEEIRDCVCEECGCKDPKGPLGSLSNSIKDIGIYLSKIGNPQGPLNGYANNNSQVIIDQRKYQNLKDQFFSVYFHQMPFLEKIYDVIKPKREFKSGMLTSALGSGNSSTIDLDPDIDIDFDTDRRRRNRIKSPKNSANKTALQNSWRAVGPFFMETILPMASGAFGAIGTAILAAPATAAVIATAATGGLAYWMSKQFGDGSFANSMDDMFSTLSNQFDTEYQKTRKALGFSYNKDKVDGKAPTYYSQEQMKGLLAQKTDSKSKLSFINEQVKNAKIKPEDAEALKNSILSENDESRKNKYGWYLTPEEINNHLGDFNKMDSKAQRDYYKDINGTISDRYDAGKFDKNNNPYNEISSKISQIFAERIKAETNKNQTNESNKELLDAIKQIQESNLNNTSVVKDMVSENNKVNKDMISTLSGALGGVAQMNKETSDSLFMTAKIAAKPNVYKLDENVIQLIPGLR